MLKKAMGQMAVATIMALIMTLIAAPRRHGLTACGAQPWVMLVTPWLLINLNSAS